MRARLVQVIEVSSGGVRRYFTVDGESIGVDARESAEFVEEDGVPMVISAAEVIAQVPKKRPRIVPPFDPSEMPCAKPGEVSLEVEI